MRGLSVLVAVLAVMSNGAGAATLSVGSLPSRSFTGTVALVPEATLTSSGTGFYFDGASPEAGSFCAYNENSYNCQNDLEISFVGAVTNLMFDVSGWNSGDLVHLNVFDTVNTLLGVVVIDATITGFAQTDLVDLTSFGAISRLFFDDNSTGGGVAYSNFAFTRAATVPLPATLPLLAGALGAAAAIRRKRKAV